METGKKVQGRGFIVFNGETFGRNMEGVSPRMHKLIAADLESKGVDVVRLNFDNKKNNETTKQAEQNIVARRSFEH